MSFSFPLIPRQHRIVRVHTTCRTPGCFWHGMDMLPSLGVCPGCRQPLTRVSQGRDR